MRLVVARIARPRGLAGEVALDLRTDTPQERLAVGARLSTVPPEAGPLTVRRARPQSGRWYATFEEATDRTAAERLRGIELVVEVDDVREADDEDSWYAHELTGLRAEHVDGRPLGTVVGLEHLPAQDALVVAEPSGARSLVPFVREIVPVVDLAGGRVVLDPPVGLLTDPPGEPEAADGSAGAGGSPGMGGSPGAGRSPGTGRSPRPRASGAEGPEA